jgi:single-strand DNA-binding protein
MPTNSNTVTVTGNLTRDPELRFTPSGQATASFAVAVNRSWQNRQTQEWNEVTSYFDVVCWAQLAENAAQSLTRGTRVIVTGRLDQRSWENQEGERRSKIEIVADEVAPSLRWATAAITKNERRGPDGNQGGGSGSYSGGGGGGGAGSNPSSGNQGPGREGSGAPETQGGYQYDEEEPF